MFNVIDTYFDGAVKVINTPVFRDERGSLSLPFIAEEFNALGIPAYFPRDMHALSVARVLRGLHFQRGMGKLIRVTKGRAFLVVVDIREFGQESFLNWISREVSEYDRNQIWIPDGFAFGYFALSPTVEIQYKCTVPFDSEKDSSIRWNDPDIGIKWPAKKPILSERDRNAPTAKEYFKLA